MADLLISDIDPGVRSLLERRAEASGRSLQAEVKPILDNAARAADIEAACREADRIRASLSDRVHQDSAEIIRAIRDR